MKFNKLKFSNSFKKLGKDFFTETLPTPLDDSFIITSSKSACQLIGLDEEEVLNSEFIEAICAKKPNPAFCHLAMLYAGHQFGHFVPQLGDGRAVLLAQVENNKGEEWDLVLKGSGLTPYSRMGDGKAVLRSSIREFLVSEAMFHLGVPTSRALCLIGSKSVAARQALEPAAQVVRMAKSHVRFGSFEVFFYRKQHDKIKILADYVIENNFPEIDNNSNQKYHLFLREVVLSTAKMIAGWQAFGFCHGVMNTDNMSILGITFDYGPFGFLDEFDPSHICNSSDYQGRYSFENQPRVGFWNLNAFAITLSSLITLEDQQEILAIYEEIFLEEYYSLMARKLGFESKNQEAINLTNDLLKILEKWKIDYSFFLRNLSEFSTDEVEKFTSNLLFSDSKNILEAFKSKEFQRWIKSYNLHLKTFTSVDKTRKIAMNKVNPKFILRNYLLEIAIQKAVLEDDFSEILKLQEIIEFPYLEQDENHSYSQIPPSWSKGIKISCSS